ncbi:MAG TPA: metallophosphoesterase [Puia sp.]|nr:metallophosphoesterase [Puia sp.]
MHGSIFLKVFLIILAVDLLLDWYTFLGIRTLTADWPSVRWRHIVNWGWLVVVVGITVVLVSGFDNFRHPSGMLPFREWVLSLFLALFLTKLFFAIVLLLGDLGRLIYGLANRLLRPAATTAGGPLIPSRRKFISELGVLAAAVPFSSFAYAMLKGKYDFRLHKVDLHFRDLPAAFDGFTITQISDIHSGSLDNMRAVQRGIDMARAQNSDLFVFTGDLVNNVAWEIEPYIERFGALKAPFGQYSILGNHDYGEYIQWDSLDEKARNFEAIKAHHSDLGYRLLMDEHVLLEKDGQRIALVGVQNWGRGFIQLGDIDKALEGLDNDIFKICLSHDPTHWEEKIRFHPTTIHLTLSGHTHGAQFGVESDHLRWSPVQYRYLDWAGLANERDRYLYVNRGFGFLAFSGRLGIWPEITVITLRKGV